MGGLGFDLGEGEYEDGYSNKVLEGKFTYCFRDINNIPVVLFKWIANIEIKAC